MRINIAFLHHSRVLCIYLLFLTGTVLPSCTTWKERNNNENIKIGEQTATHQNIDLNLESSELPSISLKSALSAYQRILKTAPSHEAQQKILRRIADLSMIATEQQLIDEVDENYHPPLEQNDKLTLKHSIKLYENLLTNTSENTNQAETLYHLAKLYDITGQSQHSLDALNKLVVEHPNSPYHVEAQFRRGENLFSSGHFASSANAYQKTVLGKNIDPRFYEQALYKLGWSHYKRNDYASSLNPFFSLLDELEKSQQKNKSLMKIQRDSYRVISLALSHLEGPQSIATFFESFGSRKYEARVYEALAMHYLQQERYSDTAKTLEFFVDSHPLHPYAPGFQTDAINALAAGGFPSLVLPAKENFVTRFGIHSAFWKYYHSENPSPEQVNVAKDLRTTLKSHLQDLSTYYHSQAIKSGIPTDYEKAAYWYWLLLETFPNNPNGLLINQLIAESLLDGGKFQEAITQFERTAEHPQSTPESAANNRYAALIAYQSLLKQPDIDHQFIKREKIDAALRFHTLHPQDKRSPAVLHNAMGMQFQLGDSIGALNSATLITQLSLTATNQLIIQSAWITLGNNYLSTGIYKEAEQAFNKALRFSIKNTSQAKHLHEQRIAAIYKQAEQFEQQGENVKAIERYLSVGRTLPNSRIRPQADFAAASLYLKTQRWQAAIAQLKAFRQNYPGHPLNETLPEKLALAYEQSKNWAHAAVEMEKTANHLHPKDPELARIALWRAAGFREKAAQTSEAIRVYKRYVRTYPHPLETLAEAQFRLSLLYKKSEDNYRSTFWRRKIVQGFYNAGEQVTPRMRYHAAQSAYQMAQPHHRQFESIKLQLPLQNSIAVKQEAMQQALKYYSYVLEIGEASFISAAFYQTGSLYQKLAADLLTSERPQELNANELEQYNILLEEEAFPFENRAIESYIKAAELTTQQVYDLWVKKCFKKLRFLLPVRYAKDEKLEGVIDVSF
ncbi:MAG: tetratricopeptide repeat protein [Pseudomonadales bacterium]|nr:tetratricopeptide repeat protein [Pseudomonadales bacterium]